MIFALYAIGGFIVGALAMLLIILVLSRRAEQAAFRSFWGLG